MLAGNSNVNYNFGGNIMNFNPVNVYQGGSDHKASAVAKNHVRFRLANTICGHC